MNPYIVDIERQLLNTTQPQPFFRHLRLANQSYTRHFKDAASYAWKAFKSSFYFICHAIWPDAFEHAGSDTIISLSNEILEKYRLISQSQN